MKAMNQLIILALATWTLMAFTGCATISVQTPQGFAAVSQVSPQRFLALSPEGIRFEVYTEANEPMQDLGFWVEAYTHYMEASGYTPYQESETLQGKMGEIHFAEWVVPYQGETYVYAQAIQIDGEKIYLTEIGGPEVNYAQYRQDILEAVRTVE